MRTFATLRWRHNDQDGVSNHQPRHCLLNCLDQSKHQSSASLAFVWEIHRGPVNFPHKWPVTRKMFPFDDVIMHMQGYINQHARIMRRTCHYLTDFSYVIRFAIACTYLPSLRWLHAYINSSLPWHNGGHFADDIFRSIFVNEKFYILIKISLKFVPTCPIDKKTELV